MQVCVYSWLYPLNYHYLEKKQPFHAFSTTLFKLPFITVYKHSVLNKLYFFFHLSPSLETSGLPPGSLNLVNGKLGSNQSILKENQPCIFTGRTDTEAEAPILWPPDVKSRLTGKDPDAGKDWGQEEEGKTEDEMVGQHHRLSGHECEQALRNREGQGSLVCQSRTQLSHWESDTRSTKLCHQVGPTASDLEMHSITICGHDSGCWRGPEERNNSTHSEIKIRPCLIVNFSHNTVIFYLHKLT